LFLGDETFDVTVDVVFEVGTNSEFVNLKLEPAGTNGAD